MFLGIEIGGTKLQLGVGNGMPAGGGAPGFVEFLSLRVDAARGGSGIREQILGVAPGLIARHDVQGVGFGFGGPIDRRRGCVVTSHQIAGWDDFPLVAWSQKLLGRPVALGNDCDVAALAEAKFGAGRGERVVFYVTIGTGVGGGLIVDREIYHGSGSIAAEIGHLRPGLAATSPRATVESLAAGPAIAAAARMLPAVDVETHHADLTDLALRAGGDLSRLTAEHVAAAAAAGNRRARAALEQSTRTLGWAIAQVVTLLAPNIVILGGGVSLIGRELFLDPVARFAAEYVFPPLRPGHTLAPAALGEAVVVHGAVALAQSLWGSP